MPAARDRNRCRSVADHEGVKREAVLEPAAPPQFATALRELPRRRGRNRIFRGLL
jgi:hypothetical protein